MKKITILIMISIFTVIMIMTSNTYAIETYSNENLAKPDITGKVEIEPNVYRIYNQNGITIDYNIINGYFTMNGTSITSALGKVFDIPVLQNGINHTISKIHISGTKTNQLNIYIAEPIQVILLDYQNDNTFISGIDNNQIIFSDVLIGNTFNNYVFKLQIEEGTTVTDYKVPIYNVNTFDKIYTYADYEVGPGSTSEYLIYGTRWRLTPTSQLRYLYEIISYYLNVPNSEKTYLMLPSDEYALYNDMGPIINIKGQYMLIYYDYGINAVRLKYRNIMGQEILLYDFYTSSDVQSIDIKKEIQVYDYDNINKWYDIGYGDGFIQGDIFGFNRGKETFGIFYNGIWQNAMQYGNIQRINGYNEGFNYGRSQFGIFTDNTWLNAEQYGNIRYNQGVSDGSNLFNVLISVVFSFITVMMTIELLPGIYTGYIVGFFIVFGIVTFITAKGKK